MPRKSEIRLGQYLVQMQWCTLRQVNQALSRQQELRAQKQHQALGRILVSQGVLDEPRLVEALAAIGGLILKCEACRKQFRVVRFDKAQDYACPRCQVKLVLGDPPPEGTRAEVEDFAPPQAAQVGAPGGSPGAASAELEKDAVAAVPRDAAAGQEDTFLGRIFGGCLLTEKVAQGGMGVVYKAKQLNLNRTVAVKILSQEFAKDASFVRRFVEEARSAAQLNHHNIVHINDVGECQQVFYFIMEFVEGENLKSILQRESQLDAARALAITLQVCHALRHAHERGIIHRDIKPENIMVTKEGVVKLADLGLAKRMAPTAADGLTQAGSVFGTPYYMAPEQARNFSDVDARSDVYSLGVTLYKMLTGRVPFDGRSPIEIMIKALQGKRSTLRELRGDVPEEVEALVDRMMHVEPSRRYQSADEVIEDLKRILGALSSRSRAERLLSCT
jgi:predicted Ser/Thr protein kinase